LSFSSGVLIVSETWTQYIAYDVCISTGTNDGLRIDGVSIETTLYSDDISIQQVTDCAATGLHIMSAKNGTTQSWYYISPTFGYNDAMTYRIYRVY